MPKFLDKLCGYLRKVVETRTRQYTLLAVHGSVVTPFGCLMLECPYFVSQPALQIYPAGQGLHSAFPTESLYVPC